MAQSSRQLTQEEWDKLTGLHQEGRQERIEDDRAPIGSRRSQTRQVSQDQWERFTERPATPDGWFRESDVPRGTLGSIMKGLRTPQQALVLGPALAVQESIQEGTPLTLGSMIRGGREAVREDLSFKEMATLPPQIGRAHV